MIIKRVALFGRDIVRLMDRVGFTDDEISSLREIFWSLGYGNWLEGIVNLTIDYGIDNREQNPLDTTKENREFISRIVADGVIDSTLSASAEINIDEFYMRVIDLIERFKLLVIINNGGRTMEKYTLVEGILMCEVICD